MRLHLPLQQHLPHRPVNPPQLPRRLLQLILPCDILPHAQYHLIQARKVGCTSLLEQGYFGQTLAHRLQSCLAGRGHFPLIEPEFVHDADDHGRQGLGYTGGAAAEHHLVSWWEIPGCTAAGEDLIGGGAPVEVYRSSGREWSLGGDDDAGGGVLGA